MYYTLDGVSSADYEIRRSVFSSTVKGISSYAEGLEFVKQTSKAHSDATHNCYAILCKTGEQKFYDDGEPTGTAGMPILQALKNSKLTDVACVVTRYFGGIKLGAGGLVSAYGKAVALALESGKVVTMKESHIFAMALSYSDVDRATRLIDCYDGKVTNLAYDKQVGITFAVPVERAHGFVDALNELFSGKREYLVLDTRYEKY